MDLYLGFQGRSWMPKNGVLKDFEMKLMEGGSGGRDLSGSVWKDQSERGDGKKEAWESGKGEKGMDLRNWDFWEHSDVGTFEIEN